MDYKTIRFYSAISVAMSAILVLLKALVTFGPWASEGSAGLGPAWSPLILVFLMLAIVTRSVASVVESQADQIAALREQVAELRKTS
jgi:hypothetical protein